MQHYNDHSNTAAANVFFMLFQIFMVLTVFGFAYTSMVAVKLAVAKYGLTKMAFLPEFLAVVGYPVVMFKTLKMFKSEKRLRAIAWMMAWASVIFVALYVHLSQLIPA